jgi:hypothetical protein
VVPVIVNATPASAELTVRAIYRQLLTRGDLVGRPRSRATTPDEHLPALQQRLAPAVALARITAAYSVVRYGERRPTAGQLASLADDWQAVQQSVARDASKSVDQTDDGLA